MDRVVTIYPDGSQAAFVDGHCEREGSTTRSYYFFGSQRVAMRVDDGVSDQGYWFHTDHPSAALRTGPSAALRTGPSAALRTGPSAARRTGPSTARRTGPSTALRTGPGSTSLLSLDFARVATRSDEAGKAAAGSETRFRPYGEYRVEPTAGLTDHGYTGHKQQDQVGLIYMRARYYVPGVGRFSSADSMVPELEDPQSLNRFGYVDNRPLYFVDPSGHRLCKEDADSKEWIPPDQDYGYRLLRAAAKWYLSAKFQSPFEGEHGMTQPFGGSHTGVDWGGQFAVLAPADGTVTQAGFDQPAGMWRIGRDPFIVENGNTQYRETREWSISSGRLLYERDRGDDGMLEPERLLATGEWVDLEAGWSHERGTIIIVEHGHYLRTVYYHTDPSVAAAT